MWRLKAGGDNPIPTPFTAHGFIYVAMGMARMLLFGLFVLAAGYQSLA